VCHCNEIYRESFFLFFFEVNEPTFTAAEGKVAGVLLSIAMETYSISQRSKFAFITKNISDPLKNIYTFLVCKHLFLLSFFAP